MRINHGQPSFPDSISIISKKIEEMNISEIERLANTPTVLIQDTEEPGPGEDIEEVKPLEFWDFNKYELWGTVSIKDGVLRRKWFEIFKFISIGDGVRLRIGASHKKAYAAGLMTEIDIIDKYRPIERPSCYMLFEHRTGRSKSAF